MIKFNLDPGEGKNWNLERVQAYYAQQIALQLERLNETLDEIHREINFWQETCDKNCILNKAIDLMTAKTEVMELFNGLKSMRFSEFRDKIYRIGICGSKENIVEAIRMTDYLDVKKSGNGFRVWLSFNSL